MPKSNKNTNRTFLALVERRLGCSAGNNAKDVQSETTPKMFSRICNPTGNNISICNAIKAE